jgi:hypothetical protein
MVLALLTAGSWFAFVGLPQGAAALQGFWHDQSGFTVATNLLQPAWIVPFFVLSYLVTFLPWSAAALRLFQQDPQNSRDGLVRPTRLFLLVWPLSAAVLFGWGRDLVLHWSLFIVVVSGWARAPEEHYLVPGGPFLAILIGGILASSESGRTRRVLKQSLAIIVAIVLAIAFAAGWLQYQLGHLLVAWSAPLYIAAAVAALGYAALRRDWLHPATAQALVVLLVFPLLGSTMRPISVPTEGEQLASRLEELRLLDGPPVLFVGKFSTTEKLRVAARGRVEVRRAERFSTEVAVDSYCAIVLPLGDASELVNVGYRLHPGSRGYDALDMNPLFAALFRGQLLEFLASRRSELVIAVPGAEDAEM